MPIDSEEIKQRIDLMHGRAILEYENGDMAIEDSNEKITLRFNAQATQNFTENWVGIIAARVFEEAGKNGTL